MISILLKGERRRNTRTTTCEHDEIGDDRIRETYVPSVNEQLENGSYVLFFKQRARGTSKYVNYWQVLYFITSSYKVISDYRIDYACST